MVNIDETPTYLNMSTSITVQTIVSKKVNDWFLVGIKLNGSIVWESLELPLLLSTAEGFTHLPPVVCYLSL